MKSIYYGDEEYEIYEDHNEYAEDQNSEIPLTDVNTIENTVLFF